MVSFEKEFPSLKNKYCEVIGNAGIPMTDMIRINVRNINEHCVDKQRLRDLIKELEEESKLNVAGDCPDCDWKKGLDFGIGRLRLLLGEKE